MKTASSTSELRASRWFTNLDHGRRHQKLPLMTMEDNLRFSKHKEIKGKAAYDRYDNYDAIEVPFTDAIPSDYDGMMGVPVTFLDKYNPDQFEILGYEKSYHLQTRKYEIQVQVDKSGKEKQRDQAQRRRSDQGGSTPDRPDLLRRGWRVLHSAIQANLHPSPCPARKRE